MRKKLLCVLLIACALLLSGCTTLAADADQLMSPPMPSGELYYIQKALDGSVNENYTLKYPTGGDYRSAFVRRDIDGDGKSEAFAFYSTSADNVVSMHVNLILKKGDEWVSVGDFKYVASGVDSVEFSDMDGDGILEVIVGWSVYGSVDKSVGVYTVKNQVFAQRVIESYTNFMCRDLDGDGKTDLFLSYIDTANQTATAKLIGLNDQGAEEKGHVLLDGNVTSHAVPVVGKLLGGNTAVYIDAVKGDGMITEILEIADGTMKNALQNEQDGTAMSTYRASSVTVMDIDKDGVYEVPMLELVTQGSYGNDNVYKTYWYAYDGKYMELKCAAFMNYADGWYITVPEKWDDRITVIRDTANRERTFMRIDEETGNSAEVVAKIHTLPIDTPVSSIMTYGFDSFELATSGQYKFVASLSTQDLPEGLTREEIKEMFYIIK